MKKSLIALSIMSLMGVTYAQNTMHDGVNHKDVPATHSLDKKILKENEKTHENLEKGKITPNQAEQLDKNEAGIAKDLSDSKQDGKVTRDEKKHIKKEIDHNKDMRDDMKKSNKEMKKEREKAMKE